MSLVQVEKKDIIATASMQHEMRLLGARRDLGCFDQLKSLSMLNPWEVQGGEMALQGYLPAPASSSMAGGTVVSPKPNVFHFPARRAMPVMRDPLRAGHKERAKVLALWQMLIVTSACGLATVLAKTADDQVPLILEDVFAKKATSTLRSRASSLLQYTRWQKATYGETSLFPMDEDRLYAYTCYLRSEGAPASRGERFVQSVRFAHTLLQCPGDLSFLTARVIGATVAGVAKRPVMKKWPLKVHQLRLLERLACGEASAVSVFAGFLCVLIHGRLRYSDAQMCFAEPLLETGDVHNLLTLELYGSKTSSLRRATKFRLIPVFAVSPGVHGDECWASAYLRNRAELGLKASETEPLMRCPCADGSFSERKLRSSDASVWLRELLGSECNEEELSYLATHSCKATCLAWLTKSAAPNNMCRRAGYHVGQEGRSELEYAHDAAAPLVRRLADTVELIREGIFCPDEPRLQRWHGASDFESAVLLLRRGEDAKRLRKSVPAQVSRLLEGSSSDSESSEDVDEDSDSAGSEADGHLADIHVLGEIVDSSASDGFVYYKHGARQTVHRAQRHNDDDAVVFVCGRLATAAHEELGARPNVILNPCLSCFR